MIKKAGIQNAHTEVQWREVWGHTMVHVPGLGWRVDETSAAHAFDAVA